MDAIPVSKFRLVVADFLPWSAGRLRPLETLSRSGAVVSCHLPAPYGQSPLGDIPAGGADLSTCEHSSEVQA